MEKKHDKDGDDYYNTLKYGMVEWRGGKCEPKLQEELRRVRQVSVLRKAKSMGYHSHDQLSPQ